MQAARMVLAGAALTLAVETVARLLGRRARAKAAAQPKPNAEPTCVQEARGRYAADDGIGWQRIVVDERTGATHLVPRDQPQVPWLYRSRVGRWRL